MMTGQLSEVAMVASDLQGATVGMGGMMLWVVVTIVVGDFFY